MSDWRSQATAVDPAQPGPQAIGSPDGNVPAPSDWKSHATQVPEDAYDKMGPAFERALSKTIPGMGIARALGETDVGKAIHEGTGKIAGYPAGIARTLAAYLAGVVKPGENPIGMGDAWDAAAGHAPGVGDQAKKFGIPDAKIHLPGETHPHVSTTDLLNMGGNAALDPLMYGGAQMLGKGMYDSSIGKIIGEGKRYGKDGVGETYNKYGIKNALTMDETVQNAVNKNMAETKATESQATRLPGSDVDMNEATAPAQQHINDIARRAREGSPQAQTAKEMQAELDNHRASAAKPAEKTFLELPYTEPKSSLTYKGPNPEVPVYDAPTMKAIDRVGTPDPVETRMGQPVKGISGTLPIVSMNEAAVPTNEKPLNNFPGKIGQEDTQGLINAIKNASREQPGKTSIATGAEDTIRTLPVQGRYDLETKMVPKMDVGETMTESKPGPTPLDSSQWKTDAYNSAKNAAYDSQKRTTEWQGFYKSLGYGLKESTEKAIAKVLGPEAAEKYSQTNADTGNLLSTKKASAMQQAQSERLRNSVTTPVANGTEGFTGALVAAMGKGDPIENLGHGAYAVALQKLAKGAQLAAMPTGYALRNTPLALTRAASIDNNMKLSPWAPQGDQNGQR